MGPRFLTIIPPRLEHMRREVTLYKPGADRGRWLEAVMRAALQHASRVVYELAVSDRRFTGMSTTASAVLVAGDLAVIGHVGDSRVYHARGGAVRQLTEDHTLRNLQVHQGLADLRHGETRSLAAPGERRNAGHGARCT